MNKSTDPHTPMALATLELADEELLLHPERLLWWPKRKTVILSDVHLGKSASLRYLGMPVPEGETATDLTRLTKVIHTLAAEQLIIVGDLLHAAPQRSPGVAAAFQAWRALHPNLQLTLVRGNHDAGQRLASDLGISVISKLYLPPFLFLHDPAEVPAASSEWEAASASELKQETKPPWTICGHLHPVIGLPGIGVGQLRAPCFWVQTRERKLILPSFGSFTGGKEIAPEVGDILHAVTDETVLPVPVALLRRVPLHKGRAKTGNAG